MPRKSVDPLSTGLPASPDCEKYCLASIMRGQEAGKRVLEAVAPEDFALDIHKKLFLAMKGMLESGAALDRVTLAERLFLDNSLESVGGLSKLLSLEEGMPEMANIDGYIAIVKEKAALRRLIFLAKEAQDQALLQDRPSAEILSGLSAKLAAESTEKREDRPQILSDYIETFPGGIERLLDPSKGDPGIPTGFERIDEITSGFHAGEIWFVAARPRIGKTSLAVNVMRKVAELDKHVLFFTLEMPKRNILNRMLCEEASIAMSRFRRGDLDKEDRRRLQMALDKISGLKIHMDQLPGRKVSGIRMRLRALMDKFPISLVCLDYVQLLYANRNHGNENERYTEIATDLQELCVSTGVPFLLLSQLTRETERRMVKGKVDARPRLSDMRGSGSWEQIGNVIGLLHREELYDKGRSELRGKAELNLEKVRDGESAVVPLKFIGWRFRFEDAPNDPQSTPETE